MDQNAEETIKIVPKDDGTLAVAILIVAGVMVIAIAIYLWKKKSSSVSDSRYLL